MLASKLRLQLILLALFSPFNLALSQDNTIDTRQCKSIVKSWNKAHNDWKFNELSRLYAPKVLFYCDWVSKSVCIQNKTSQMNPARVFRQRLASEINITPLSDELTLCRFTKEVTTDDGKTNYPAYLVLKNINNELRIVAESDDITDRNMNITLTEDLFNNPSRNSKTLKPEKTPDSAFGLPFYSITSISTIAIIAFAARRRRKRKALEYKSEPPVENNMSSQKESSGNGNATPAEPNPTENKKPAEEIDSSLPENVIKGLQFEKFVVHKLPKNRFEVLEWRSDKSTNGRYATSSLDPDLEIRCIITDPFKTQRFVAIECKYRSKFYNNELEIATVEQLERYTAFSQERKMKVYIVLGFGNTADDPSELYMIPLKDIRSNVITKQQLSRLENRISKWFRYDLEKETLV